MNDDRLLAKAAEIEARREKKAQQALELADNEDQVEVESDPA